MSKYLEKIAELAVIVKGNPKYIKKPRIKPMADQFYSDIKSILENQGYSVELNPGRPYTRPDISAALWVGHSRGVDRLRFAEPNIKTIALKTLTDDWADKGHYQLSEEDLKNLKGTS